MDESQMDEAATSSETATDMTATTATGNITANEANEANEASAQSVQSGEEDNMNPSPEDLIRARNRRETEELIAKLCLKCEDPEMREHIRLYEYGRGTEAIKRRLKQVRNEPLLNLLRFLNNGVANQQLPTLKKEIIHEIVCRIQNLLPDTCGMCDARYQLELEENPIMPCTRCFQSSHRECILEIINRIDPSIDINNLNAEEAKKLYNPLNIPGVRYLCKECDEAVVPKLAITEDQAPEDTDSAVTIPALETIPDTSGDNDVTSVNTDNDPPPNPPPNNRPSNNMPSNNETNPRMQKDILCKFHSRGSCRHGINGNGCNYSHPEVCRKFTNHGTRQPRGCNRGKKCKFLHPLMCIDSLRRGECLNQRCGFRHVGTKRAPPNERREFNVSPASAEMRSQNQWHQNHQIQDEHSGDTRSHGANQQDQDHYHQHIDSSSHTPDHFLEVGRLWKADILQEMDTRLQSIQTLIMNLHQAKELSATINNQSQVFNPSNRSNQLQGEYHSQQERIQQPHQAQTLHIPPQQTADLRLNQQIQPQIQQPPNQNLSHQQPQPMAQQARQGPNFYQPPQQPQPPQPPQPPGQFQEINQIEMQAQHSVAQQARPQPTQNQMQTTHNRSENQIQVQVHRNQHQIQPAWTPGTVQHLGF